VVHRVVIVHRSIYTTGDFGCDKVLENQLVPILDEFHVKLVITGHSHLFEAFYRPDLNEPVGTAFVVAGGGGGRLDLVASRISAAPYKWDEPVHVAKAWAFLRGNRSSPFRNDEAVLQFQEFGKICHHVLHVRIRGDELNLRAIEWGGTVIYEKSF
jgi:hypothetical protein